MQMFSMIKLKMTKLIMMLLYYAPFWAQQLFKPRHSMISFIQKIEYLIRGSSDL